MIVATKDEIATIESEITNQKVKIQSQKKLIDALEANRQNVVASLRQKILINNESIAKAQYSVALLNDEIAQMSRAQSSHDEVSSAIAKATKMKLSCGG